jgi:hypothetical protein
LIGDHSSRIGVWSEHWERKVLDFSCWSDITWTKIVQYMLIRPREFVGCDIGSYIPLVEITVRVTMTHNDSPLTTRPQEIRARL